MKRYIVDTNVAIVANARDTHASSSCILAAIEFLQDLKNGLSKRILIDDLGHVLDEYINNLRMSGQPGVGDAFLKWVFDNQAVDTRVEVINLEFDPTNHSYAAFPVDSRLERFDRSDRKFVAIAKTCSDASTIANCVDSDWAEFAGILTEHDVFVRFLCPDHVNAS